MTRTAGCPLGGAQWARGGAGSGVVGSSGSTLYPTAVRAPSLVVPSCVDRAQAARQHNEEMYKKVSTNSVQQSDATSR